MSAIVVTAAIVEIDDRFLVTRRRQGSHLAGFWEFPGGKCDNGETLEECLARELLEELGAAARVGVELLATTHVYADRSVELHFFRCELLSKPRPVLGQDMQWVRRDDLATLEFPPADAEMIRILTQA